MHVGGRIAAYASGSRSREFMEKHSTHYKLILPHKALITQAIVLNEHQRNICCSASLVEDVLNEQFHLPRAQMTIKNIIIKCAVCLLGRCSKNKIEPHRGNIKELRIPRKVGDEKSRPYRVVYYNIKGTIRVNDYRKFKKVKKKKNEKYDEDEDQTLKAYVLSASCALPRHIRSESRDCINLRKLD